MNEFAGALTAGILVLISASVQHFYNVRYRGLEFVLGDRSGAEPIRGFGERATRTLQNNLESACMVVPCSVVLYIDPNVDTWYLAFATLYSGARISFNISYLAGFYLARSASWGVGMICIAGLNVGAIEVLISASLGK
jgi:uncharacterized MAPEG superfamily protein